MTRIEERYWIETDNFIESSNITQNLQNEGIQGTKYPNVKTPQSTVDNPILSRFEIYPIAQLFLWKTRTIIFNHDIQHNIFVTCLDLNNE